ncbi:MAG: hypothetical protein LUD72_12155 [Bacteroidales bacterium]|nr:hypothetical protein [Bacteroidales bacterium]
MKPRRLSRKEEKKQRRESPVKHRFFCLQASKYKLLFDSKEKAIRYLRWNANAIKEENGYAPTRAYYCTYCAGWHVTSSRKFIKHKDAPLENTPEEDDTVLETEEPASESADSQTSSGMVFYQKDIPSLAETGDV